MTDKKKASTAVKKKPVKRRSMGSEQLGIVRGLWEAGIGSKAEIAEEVGATVSQVDYAISKHGWVQGARAEYYEEKAREAIENEMGERAKKLAVNRESAKERALSLTNLIESRMVKAFQDNAAKSLEDEAILGTLKTLESASRVIQNTFHTKRYALGLDKDENGGDDELSQIEIFEMTADEVNEIREEQERSLAQMDAVEKT